MKYAKRVRAYQVEFSSGNSSSEFVPGLHRDCEHHVRTRGVLVHVCGGLRSGVVFE